MNMGTGNHHEHCSKVHQLKHIVVGVIKHPLKTHAIVQI